MAVCAHFKIGYLDSMHVTNDGTTESGNDVVINL